VIGLQDAAELIPGPGEVVARPVPTGICGTNLELVAGLVDPAYVRWCCGRASARGARSSWT
jgi:threonine dehydrogenase-like Zn-dependent dehydrogenase